MVRVTVDPEIIPGTLAVFFCKWEEIGEPGGNPYVYREVKMKPAILTVLSLSTISVERGITLRALIIHSTFILGSVNCSLICHIMAFFFSLLHKNKNGSSMYNISYFKNEKISSPLWAAQRFIPRNHSLLKSTSGKITSAPQGTNKLFPCWIHAFSSTAWSISYTNKVRFFFPKQKITEGGIQKESEKGGWGEAEGHKHVANINTVWGE